MLLDTLATPALLLDRSRLFQNLDAMQATADANEVALRPHGKTHKCTALAHEQMNRGAVGLTVSTLAEAEAFAAAGLDDLRIAYPVVGEERYARVLGLMDDATVSFCVDTEAGIRQASAFFADAERPVDVLLEIDVGHGRCGVPWDRAPVADRAQQIADAPGLRFTGILTHAGQAYRDPQGDESIADALQRVATSERDRMLDVAVRLRDAGIPGVNAETFTISIGSTPTMAHFVNTEREGFRITEIRPGNYVTYDAMQVALGSAALDDCALTVYSTVVSKRRDPSGAERLYIDAGKKVLTTDTGAAGDTYGTVLYSARYMRPHPHAVITALSEEHGWLRVPGGATYGVGDRLRLVPNHACVTFATQSQVHVVDDGEITDTWAIDARGW
jgi:D-serine deaminase-like pyridoxal phosphate-dependent protein